MVREKAVTRLDDASKTFDLGLTHRRVDLKYVPQVPGSWHTLLEGLEMRMRGTAPFRFMDRLESNLTLYPAKT